MASATKVAGSKAAPKLSNSALSAEQAGREHGKVVAEAVGSAAGTVSDAAQAAVRYVQGFWAGITK